MGKRKAAAPPPKKSVLPPWRPYVLGLAALAFAVYANSLANGFVGDDKDQLLGNPVVSGHRIAAAFTSGVWAFRGVQGNYYRPLQFVIYILLHALFGFQATGFHLFFALTHALNTILVHFLTMQVTARTRIAVAAAALFAVHPIHTEVVDWIASMPDLMVTTLTILAVWWFAREQASPRGPQIAGHCALFLAALLSKETGIVLLPLYAGFEVVCLGRSPRELKRNLVFYSAMLGTLALYLWARWSALGGLAPAQGTFHHLTPPQFGMSAIVIAAQYIGALILPLDLNYFHVFHATTHVTSGFLISLAALAAVAVASCLRMTPRAVRYGILWMALSLAPVLNLTGVGQNVFAERYLYLPSVAFAWIAAMAWAWWDGRQPRVAWKAGVALLCVAGWAAAVRNADWRDDFTLLRKTVAQSPDAGVLHNNLAGAYLERNLLDRALEHERLAVQLEPRSAPYHKNFGILLMSRDPRAGIAEFEEALRLQPSDAQLRAMLEEARRSVPR
jgi:hypothetical protein